MILSCMRMLLDREVVHIMLALTSCHVVAGAACDVTLFSRSERRGCHRSTEQQPLPSLRPVVLVLVCNENIGSCSKHFTSTVVAVKVKTQS